MKILFIASASYRGGATLSLISLIDGIQQKGVDVHVITPTSGFLCKELDKLNVTYSIIPIHFSVWPPYKSLSDICKYPFRLGRLIITNSLAIIRISSIIYKWKPDIIHTNVSVINVGYIVSKIFRINHIWHIREYGDKDFDLIPFPTKQIKKKRLSEKSFAIAITQDLSRYFELKSKSRIIYNPIEESRLCLIHPKKKQFIYAGLLSKNKGVSELIDAFCDFGKNDTEYELFLYGNCDSRYKNELSRIISLNAMSDRIHIMNSTNDIYSKMQESKAIIVSSKCEGFGRITAEAMVNNCLVIGRNTGGTREQLDNGVIECKKEIGLRYENIKELISAMHTAAKMSEIDYNEIIANAKTTALKLYNPQLCVDKTYSFYDEIITNN